MDKWLEVLSAEGDVYFVNPAHIVAVALLGNKTGEKGAFVGTVQREITTRDTASVERLRAFAFDRAGLDAEGTSVPPAAPPQGAAHDEVPGRRVAQEAAARGAYDEDAALRRLDDESERENPSAVMADIELNKEGPA